jgi:predicted component of type VI protein secretion system
VKIRIVSVLGVLALAPIAAQADEQQDMQDRQACMADAQTFCGQFIPDREHVARCLIANRRRISVACRVALKRFK